MWDNGVGLILVAGTITMVFLILFMVFVLLVQKQKQNKYQAEKAELITKCERKILQARIDEQEATMYHMSSEIHDHVGQVLSLLRMNLSAIEKLSVPGRQSELILESKSILEIIIADTSNLSRFLNSDFINNQGLEVAIKSELAYATAAGGIKSFWETTGESVIFSFENSILIFRIAQEALHNISKHSFATEVVAKIAYESDRVQFLFSDNGQGFNSTSTENLNGIGFLNMIQRTKLLGGKIKIDSQPGNGCAVLLEVPVVS